MYMFFDTETTGKADFHAQHDDESQPHLVQLGALLTNAQGGELKRINRIVKPDGWTVPFEAAQIHGFTTERCEAEGIPLSEVLTEFNTLLEPPIRPVIVAHNIPFDLIVMQSAFHRAGWRDLLAPFARTCTMELMTPICRLPGRYGYKWPKPTEAYQHCFGRTFEGAHEAFADVVACKDVFFWLKKSGYVQD